VGDSGVNGEDDAPWARKAPLPTYEVRKNAGRERECRNRLTVFEHRLVILLLDLWVHDELRSDGLREKNILRAKRSSRRRE
jgi:hypothetical protein